MDVSMFVGVLEELEITGPEADGLFRVLLRHRDESGRVYAVPLQARRVLVSKLTMTDTVVNRRRVVRFPSVPVAAALEKDTLWLFSRTRVRDWKVNEGLGADVEWKTLAGPGAKA